MAAGPQLQPRIPEPQTLHDLVAATRAWSISRIRARLANLRLGPRAFVEAGIGAIARRRAVGKLITQIDQTVTTTCPKRPNLPVGSASVILNSSDGRSAAAMDSGSNSSSSSITVNPHTIENTAIGTHAASSAHDGAPTSQSRSKKTITNAKKAKVARADAT